MDFNVQDPTARGPFFDYLRTFVESEQAYIDKRKAFFEAIHFTFPSFLGDIVNAPQPTPVTHITDGLPESVANVVPDVVTNAVPQPVRQALPSLWSRFRGQHG